MISILKAYRIFQSNTVCFLNFQLKKFSCIKKIMNESISESESNISKDKIHADETDIVIVAENRGNQLQQINDSLQKDNNKLRAQFDEAVRIVKKVDDIHHKNISLSNEIRELKSQKEDLERRLQIQFDINEELNIKLADQKAALHEQRRNDIAALQNELKNSENQSKLLNDDFSLKISQIEEEKEKLKIELKIQQNTITRLIDSASHYFELSFDSAEKVITFLNRPPLTVNEAKSAIQASSTKTAKDEEIEKVEKKNSKVLKKLNEANIQIASLKAELSQADKDQKSIEQNYKKKISQLKSKIQQINEDNQMNEEDHSHQVLVLNQQIESLQTTIQNLKDLQNKEQNTKPAQIIEIQPTQPANNDDANNPQIEAFEAEVDSLKQKNNELDSINKKQEIKIGEMTDRIQKLEDSIDALKKDYNRAFNDLAALNLIHDSTTKEVETLRQILHTKKSTESVISKKTKKIENLKEQVYKLNEQLKIKKEKDENERMQNEEEKLNYQNQVVQLKKENGQLHSQIFELTEKVNSLTSDLNFNTTSANASAPITAPSCIQKVPENDSEIPMKIRQLQKNCKSKLESIQKEKDEVMTQKEELEKQFSDFMLKLSSIVLSKPFLEDNQEELITSIIELKNSNDSFKQQNLILSSIVNHMINTFHFSQSGDTSVLIPDIDNFSSEFERKKNILKKRKFLIEKLQKVLSQKDESIEMLELRIKKFEEQELQLEESIRNYQQENQKMNRLIQSQESQISNFDKIQSDNETASQKHYNEALIEWKQTEHSYRESISNLTMKNDELEIQISKLNEVNKQLKLKIHNHKAKILSMKLQNDELAKNFNEKKIELDNQYLNEKNSYEETVKNLQNKLEEQRLDIEKLAKQLSCSKNKVKTLKCDMKNAKEQQTIFQRSLEEQRSQLEREKQLIVGSAKAQTLFVENEFASKLDERINHWEKEKKKIFSYVADQFRQFFNPIDVIDEVSFKNVIANVKQELIKLQSMEIEIRRLVGAQSNQRTEDAVAQIVIGQDDLYY